MCDLLWSDPERNEPGWGENDRGCSYTFGPKIVDQFCTAHGFDLVCRAHQVMDGGYEFFCKRKLATVFSASNYCGDQGNRGSILNVDKRLKCSLVILLPNDDQETHELLAGTTSASSSVGAGQAMRIDPPRGAFRVTVPPGVPPGGTFFAELAAPAVGTPVQPKPWGAQTIDLSLIHI